MDTSKLPDPEDKRAEKYDDPPLTVNVFSAWTWDLLALEVLRLRKVEREQKQEEPYSNAALTTLVENLELRVKALEDRPLPIQYVPYYPYYPVPYIPPSPPIYIQPWPIITSPQITWTLTSGSST
jgi:hypothetical protein